MPKLSQPHVYQLKVSLQDITPMIWRRLLVRSDSTISDLHYAIQIAIGWSDLHLNRFHIHGQDYGVYHDGGTSFDENPERVLLSAFGFRVRERFLYEYDFGDAWLHDIRIEKRLPLEPKQIYPLCIDGEHAAPPEDCGGSWAYMRMRKKRKSSKLSRHNRIEDDLDDEWSEEARPIDPDAFSRRKVNARLRQYTKGDRDWLFSY
jgi:hypothetical protein